MKRLCGFSDAWRGILRCFRGHNFRIHIAAAVTVLLFAVRYGLERTQYPVLILVIAQVLSLEAVNTALETLCDYACRGVRHPKIRIAKDVAAGAVLLSAIGAVACACFFFSDAEKWHALLSSIQTRDIVVLLCYVLLCAAWILLPKFDIPPRNNEKENQ